MQKVFFSLALVAGASFAAQAQSITYGIKAGASLTTLNGKDTDDLKNIFGFHGGVVANFAVNDVFSIQPEVLYSMKGAKTEVSYAGSTQKVTARLHYIDVPILARINAGGLFFELGPQVGFNVAAKQTTELSGAIGSGSSTKDVKDQISNADFGYAAGLGYQLSNGPGIGLRYNGGFTDVSKESSSSAVRNSAFQLYVSYMFGGK